jgi:hypothetical protein
MKNENFSQIPDISSIFQIFLALFLKISRQFVISWTFLWNSGKISSTSKFRRKIANFIEKREWKMKFHFHSGKNLDDFLLKFRDLSGAKVWKSCRSRKMQQNEPLVAIVAVDKAENEPLKVWGWFHSFFIRLLIGVALPFARALRVAFCTGAPCPSFSVRFHFRSARGDLRSSWVDGRKMELFC